MIPADLLDRLQKADPELYSKFRYTEIATYIEYDDFGNTKNYIYQEDLIEPAQEAWLLFCLMQAIRTRGWGYAIGRSSKGMTSASVYVPGGEGETVMGYDEAEGLLRAYLQAIQEAT